MSLFRPPRAWPSFRQLGFAFALVALPGLGAGEAVAKDTGATLGSVAAVQTIKWSDLPAEAQATERLVRAGGPFPYSKDGVVFGNRERFLPARPRGFYREYTVRTQGSRDRGARRIVCGGQPPSRPETCYYSDDHYASFRRIDR